MLFIELNIIYSSPINSLRNQHTMLINQRLFSIEHKKCNFLARRPNITKIIDGSLCRLLFRLLLYCQFKSINIHTSFQNVQNGDIAILQKIYLIMISIPCIYHGIEKTFNSLKIDSPLCPEITHYWHLGVRWLIIY